MRVVACAGGLRADTEHAAFADGDLRVQIDVAPGALGAVDRCGEVVQADDAASRGGRACVHPVYRFQRESQRQASPCALCRYAEPCVLGVVGQAVVLRRETAAGFRIRIDVGPHPGVCEIGRPCRALRIRRDAPVHARIDGAGARVRSRQRHVDGAAVDVASAQRTVEPPARDRHVAAQRRCDRERHRCVREAAIEIVAATEPRILPRARGADTQADVRIADVRARTHLRLRNALAAVKIARAGGDPRAGSGGVAMIDRVRLRVAYREPGLIAYAERKPGGGFGQAGVECIDIHEHAAARARQPAAIILRVAHHNGAVRTDAGGLDQRNAYGLRIPGRRKPLFDRLRLGTGPAHCTKFRGGVDSVAGAHGDGTVRGHRIRTGLRMTGEKIEQDPAVRGPPTGRAVIHDADDGAAVVGDRECLRSRGPGRQAQVDEALELGPAIRLRRALKSEASPADHDRSIARHARRDARVRPGHHAQQHTPARLRPAERRHRIERGAEGAADHHAAVARHTAGGAGRRRGGRDVHGARGLRPAVGDGSGPEWGRAG